MLVGLVGATCRDPSSAYRREPFPDAAGLKQDPAFTVLVDSLSISGRPLVVLGTQSTFGRLRQKLAPRLQAYGWKISSASDQALSEDTVLAAQKDEQCIYFWNMNPGSFAPGMRTEAIRENPDFELEASRYVTVFRVWISGCG